MVAESFVILASTTLVSTLAVFSIYKPVLSDISHNTSGNGSSGVPGLNPCGKVLVTGGVLKFNGSFVKSLLLKWKYALSELFALNVELVY